MTIEEKKGYVLKYIRLGMDLMSSMIVAECTDDEIAVLDEDAGFQRSAKLAVKIEEMQAMEAFHQTRKRLLAQDDTRDTRWWLSKVNPSQWGDGVIKVKGSGSGLNIKINFGDASEANADADNVEEFTGVKAGEAPLGAGPAECPPGDTSGAY